MFAASPQTIRKYRENGSCGRESLDYAIELLLRLGEGGYSTSEIALLETVGVASRLGGKAKAEELFKAVTLQEGLRVLETRSLAYPLSFELVLSYQLEARDSLHLSVAILNSVSKLITSDADFADRTELMIESVKHEGLQLPGFIKTMYQIQDEEADLLEKRLRRTISLLSISKCPA